MESSKKYIGRFWKVADDSRILCQLCPRFCKIENGKRGFCFVRQNIDNQMVLSTYGRSSGFCIDPIEKKPLNHFYPGTSVLSFGTAGCNLGCKFCQNWDMSRCQEFDRLTEKASPLDIARAAKKLGCRSVAFTYNDPVIFAEYAIDIAQACHDLDVKTVAVTAGYISDEARGDFFKHMDAANVDLKAFTDHFYQKFTSGKIQPVLDTLVYLKEETDIWFEITTLLISGENDSEKELSEMTEWIVNHLGQDVPIHFTAFHPSYRLMDYPSTDPKTLSRARDLAISQGLKYVFTGNVHDQEGDTTFCHSCGNILIERDWYELKQYHLKSGNLCDFCGTECSGHFDDCPGEWGAKRRPVRI